MINPFGITKKQFIKYALNIFFFSLTITFGLIMFFITGGEKESIKPLEQWHILLIISIFLGIHLVGLSFAWLMVKKHQFYDSKDGFVVQKGILFKKVTTIPYERINTIGIKRSLLDLILGMTVIQIDSGAVASLVPEAQIPVSKDYAKVLKYFLEHKKHEPSLVLEAASTNKEFHEENQDIFYKVKTKDLWLMGLIKPGSLLTVCMIFLVTIVSMFYTRYSNEFEYEDPMPEVPVFLLWAIVIAAIITLIALVIMMVRTWMKYYQYTIKVKDDRLEYNYGLFHKVTFSIHKSKVNAVHIKQSLGYRAFKYYALEASIIGVGELNQDNQQQAESKYLMPIAKKEQIDKLLCWLSFDIDEKKVFKAPVKLKTLNFLWLPLIAITLLMLPLPIILGSYLYEIWPLFVCYGLTYLWMIWYLILNMKRHAYDVNHDLFMIKKGAFTQVLSATKKKRIQMISYRQNPIQLLENLGHVVLTYKGFAGSIQMKNYDKETFESIRGTFL